MAQSVLFSYRAQVTPKPRRNLFGSIAWRQICASEFQKITTPSLRDFGIKNASGATTRTSCPRHCLTTDYADAHRLILFFVLICAICGQFFFFHKFSRSISCLFVSFVAQKIWTTGVIMKKRDWNSHGLPLAGADLQSVFFSCRAQITNLRQRGVW